MTPKYQLLVSKGYFLDFIDRDPTGQAAKQKGVYGKDTPLNVFYCKKVCSQGFYYDFDSISCRRCNFGCALCSKFEECDLCEPGFNKVKKPAHLGPHPIEEEMIGQCQVGCQQGFYVDAFNGECLECHPECLKCMDSVFVFKEKYNKDQDEPSFCIDCLQDPTPDVPGKIINLTNGICQAHCAERKTTGSVIPGVVADYCYSCGRGCANCEITDTSRCTSCQKRFYFQNFTRECLRLTETSEFKMYAILAIIALSLICCFGSSLFAWRVLTNGHRAKQKKVLAAWKRVRVSRERLSQDKAASIITRNMKSYVWRKRMANKILNDYETPDDERVRERRKELGYLTRRKVGLRKVVAARSRSRGDCEGGGSGTRGERELGEQRGEPKPTFGPENTNLKQEDKKTLHNRSKFYY